MQLEFFVSYGLDQLSLDQPLTMHMYLRCVLFITYWSTRVFAVQLNKTYIVSVPLNSKVQLQTVVLLNYFAKRKSPIY